MAPSQTTSLDLAFDKGLQLAFPPMMVQLLHTLLDPAPSLSSIAGILKMDPMLTGKVLHIVNSVSYGFEQKITDLQRAVIAIGTNDLFKLVISLSLQKNLQPTTPRDPELVFGDWRMTLWGALSAEAIAEQLCPRQKGEAYLVGMLKDLPLLLALCRDTVPLFLHGKRLVTLPEPDDSAQELLVWGRTHAEQTHDIFLYWKIPQNMAEAVQAHHDFEGVSGHSPFVRSIIYATRWAELLHSTDVNPGRLISLELALGAELGFDMAAMERFRLDCTDKFNLLLGQLGINKAAPEIRLHEQSLCNIQGYYCLALEVLGDISPHSSRNIALAMQRQLRLFWGISTWDMRLLLPGSEQETLFHCNGDTLLVNSPVDGWIQAEGQRDRNSLPISSGKRQYGRISVPVKFADPGKSTMPLFAHMLGMCLEEHSRRLAHLPVNSSMEGLPFLVAKLDREGRIQDASSAFLDTFGLPELPVGLDAANLLEEHVGLSKNRLNAVTGAMGTGTIISVPEGRFPGTPLYLSRSICESASNSSCLLLGDVLQLSPLQSLALAHPGILEALFAGISEQICLLSEEGVVLWADSTSQELMGRNIFSITKPESSFSDAWDSSFLAGLSHSAALHGLLTNNGTETHCSLHFSLLGGSTLRRYLMVMRSMIGDTALMDTANSLPNNQRDTLTGLYGYSQFHMLLRQEAALGKTQKSSLGILFCEIISLREVNMRHGVHKGDMVLRQLAESIVASCRPGQDHPCRYGSDKFAVVVSKATGALMESLAGNIRRQIEERLNTLVRINIGLVLIHPDESPRAKLSQAKKAARQVASTEQDFCWADQSVS